MQDQRSEQSEISSLLKWRLKYVGFETGRCRWHISTLQRRPRKEMTPDEAAEEFYPKDKLIYPIAKAIYEGEEDDVVDGLQAAIDAGKNLIALIDDALMVGMGVVTQLYDDGIIFLPNVMMSADAMLAGIEYCKTKTTEVPEPKGKVVCHVAEGDVHDIGKNIVVALLRANGYDVVDLGRDVPVDEVIECVTKRSRYCLQVLPS